MARKFQQTNPSDARIFINYKDRKNPVRFEYPRKMNAFNVVYFSFLMAWLKIVILILIVNIPLFVAWAFRFATAEPDYKAMALFFVVITTAFNFMISTPVIPTLIFLSSEKLMKKMPRIQMKLALFGLANDMQYVKVKKLKSKVYEIPLFSNIYLEYKAKKDFSKFLEKVEIVEHDFYYLKRTLIRNKLKRTRQTDLWRARFIFSEIPQTGELKIEYM